MSTVSNKKRKEINRNFAAMTEKIDEYMEKHANQYALMHDGKVVEFYIVWEDAYRTGNLLYKDGLFSIQKVTKTPVWVGMGRDMSKEAIT
ncbi:MAG: hypothetical protein ACR2PR_03765 [Pseudohongiellaceae bacterium]